MGKKGPKWSDLSVRPWQHFFSELIHEICLIFCMKFRDHKYSKLEEPSFFLGIGSLIFSDILYGVVGP